MARYLERAEDTARLVNAYSHLILDIPVGSEPGWEVLIDTVDARDTFHQRYKRLTERNVIKFLLADQDNPSSIRASIKAARENVRTTRDVLPAQTWEVMNELNLFVSENASHGVARRNRFEFLEEIIAGNQQLNGAIRTTVVRDDGFWFICLGQLVERCDMTSRIMDVATKAIGRKSQMGIRELPLLWGNLLRSLSATSGYRREVGPLVTGGEVIEYMMTARLFPRSLSYCIDRLEESAARLDAHLKLMREIRALARQVSKVKWAEASMEELHKEIDQFQLSLGEVHTSITNTWFPPVES